MVDQREERSSLHKMHQEYQVADTPHKRIFRQEASTVEQRMQVGAFLGYLCSLFEPTFTEEKIQSDLPDHDMIIQEHTRYLAELRQAQPDNIPAFTLSHVRWAARRCYIELKATNKAQGVTTFDKRMEIYLLVSLHLKDTIRRKSQLGRTVSTTNTHSLSP